jgi:hypothetical protein
MKLTEKEKENIICSLNQTIASVIHENTITIWDNPEEPDGECVTTLDKKQEKEIDELQKIITKIAG